MGEFEGERVDVLDCGYVRLVEHWGSDERVIESARMSTNKGFLGWGATCVECGFSQGDDHEAGCSRPEKWKPGDEKLLGTLWRNGHHSPFEMAGAVFEIKAPIAVFREHMRHRSASYNEMSARYTPLPDENYLPTTARVLVANLSTTNHQAKGVVQRHLSEGDVTEWLAALNGAYKVAEDAYQLGLRLGVPKELARLSVPVGRYSRMRTSALLRNWLHFLSLRMDVAAQWEIRQFANVIHDELGRLFPRTVALFDDSFANGLRT